MIFDDLRGPMIDEETRQKIAQDPEFARQMVLERLAPKPIDADIQSKFSDEARQAIQKDIEGKSRGTLVAQAFGGLGDIIAGRGPSSAPYEAARQKLEGKVSDFDKQKQAAYGDLFQKEKLGEMKSKQEIEARENDPMSPESMVAKEAAKRMGYSGDIESLTASQFKRFSPAFEKIYSIEQKKLARQDALAARAQERQMAGAAKVQAEEMKKEEKKLASDEKLKAGMQEIESRRRNIVDNLDKLDEQIKKYGTYELTGPQNEQMMKMVTDVATDVAKLMDPQSVAREGEVKLIADTLVQPTLGMSNETARALIRDFKSSVQDRVKTAYDVRGLEAPQYSGKTSAPEQSLVRRKMKDGRTALFDASTKEFVRYE